MLDREFDKELIEIAEQLDVSEDVIENILDHFKDLECPEVRLRIAVASHGVLDKDEELYDALAPYVGAE